MIDTFLVMRLNGGMKNKPGTVETWIRVKEASELVGVHPKTVLIAVRNGAIRSHREGTGKTCAVLVDPEEVKKRWGHLERASEETGKVGTSGNGNVHKTFSSVSKGDRSTIQALNIIIDKQDGEIKYLREQLKTALDAYKIREENEQTIRGIQSIKAIEAPKSGWLSRVFGK